MNTLKIAYQHIQFGKVSIVDTHELDPGYVPSAEFVAGESSIDASASGEVVQDDTAAFVAEVKRDEVYLKLPMFAFLLRFWAWFDEKFGVTYR